MVAANPSAATLSTRSQGPEIDDENDVLPI
jgi:hypothetical protein